MSVSVCTLFPKPAKTTMLSSTYCFFFLASSLFLSTEAAPHIPSRRILHEPSSTLSSDPPSYPLSTSASSTPPGSPFFPSFPSAPPPPPPSTFASFPANISSLLIPHTPSPKHHHHSLFILAIAAVFSASIIASIIIFIYCRQRGRRRGGHNCFDDNKTPTSENSTALYHNNNNNVVGSRQPRTTTTTSSEFLYLGNVVNSQNRFEEGYNDSPGSSKMYSPELHPLPPLSRQNTCPDFQDGEVGSVTEYEQEEEEFYSPRGSLGGRESSTGIGSGSRRVVKNIESRSTCSCSSSSSGSGSPTKSQFLNISPQASFSPRWPDSESPEVVQVYRSSSPQRILVDSARVSDASINGNIRSPSLSSPNRVLIENLDASIKNFNTFVQNMKPPSILAPAATNSPPRDSSVCSSLNSPSPNKAFEESLEMSHLKVDFPDYNKSPSLSSLASSSPERCLEKSPDHASSLSLSKALQKPILSPPPPPPPKQQRLWETPVSSASFAKQIPKPPRPPPPPKQQRLWEVPVSSASFAKEISKPLPPLMPTKSESEAVEEAEEALKPKLKSLHWDKVRASSDREMVWDHLRSSSFQLDEEMIETLFVVNTSNSKPKQTTPRSVLSSPIQENIVLDPKKAQNIAILLKALNVTVEEVSEALLEGNADTLGTEFLESLSRMAPTKEEECKLKEYKDDSPVKLGPAEKFLKTLLDIPFAFKRVDAMLYIANFESEAEFLRNSFETLEAACEELKNSRMFLKLLDAVLKSGNRMNIGTYRGDAHAFKLDTLLKLVDVKGADGKTTLLHFVVQEIIRAEGARLSNTNQTPISTLTDDARCRKLGLQVVSGLSSELTNVQNAAAMDYEVLGGYVSKLSVGLGKIKEVLRLNETMGSDESKERYSESMNMFMQMVEQEIPRIQAHENLALSLVKEITEYFHGDSAKEEGHPFRIFLVVKDFLTVLDRVCREVGMINERTIVSSAHKFPVPVNPMMH